MEFYFLNKVKRKLEEISVAQPQFQKALKDQLYRGELIWLFQKALLSGEYYSGSEELLSTIDALLSSLQAVTKSQIVMVNGQPRSVMLTDNDPTIVFIRENYVQMYRDLVRNLDKGLEDFSTGQDGKIVDIQLFEGYIIIKDLAEILELDARKKASIEHYNTFLIGLLLVYLDEYLECTDEGLRVLKRINYFLGKAKINKFSEDVIKIYRDKAEFLQYKIEYRNSHHTNEGEKGERQLPELSDKNVYYPLKEKIAWHYKDLQNAELHTIQVKAYQACEPVSGFNIEAIHNYNKYFHKLCSKNYDYRKNKIDSLLSKLRQNEAQLVGDSLYDKIGYRSMVNLLSNSSFHLRLKIQRANEFPDLIPHFQKFIRGESKTLEPEILVNFIRTASSIAEDGELTDYYCYIILIKFLNSFNNFLVENPEKLVPTEDVKTDVAELRFRFIAVRKYLESVYVQTLSDLKDSLRKMKSYEAKPVYLTMRECMMPYTWPKETEQGFLFLDSSYVLPNNFEKIFKKVESWEAFLAPQMSILLEAFEVVLSGIHVKSNISTFEGKMKENEFKVVQIVALFVSIATFVLINVKIFDNKSGLESFGIIIGLTSCFFLFNLFLYFIFLAQFRGGTASKNFLLKILLWLVAPMALATASFFILNQERFSSGSEIKVIRERLIQDSIQIRHLLDQQ